MHSLPAADLDVDRGTVLFAVMITIDAYALAIHVDVDGRISFRHNDGRGSQPIETRTNSAAENDFVSRDLMP